MSLSEVVRTYLMQEMVYLSFVSMDRQELLSVISHAQFTMHDVESIGFENFLNKEVEKRTSALKKRSADILKVINGNVCPEQKEIVHVLKSLLFLPEHFKLNDQSDATIRLIAWLKSIKETLLDENQYDRNLKEFERIKDTLPTGHWVRIEDGCLTVCSPNKEDTCLDVTKECLIKYIRNVHSVRYIG